MSIEGPALRLRLYIGEADRWHGRALSEAIVLRLRELGIAGATVVRGIEGYGRNAHLHTAKILRLSEDLPIVIDVVDREARIREVLPELDAMVGDGLITVEPVEVVAYRAGRGQGATAANGGEEKTDPPASR
jgi:PII-like signaling protein